MATIFAKTNIAQLKANVYHFKTIPGILKLCEFALGLICFGCILLGSSRYYDPYIGANAYGFAGGIIETSFLLNNYACLFGTFLIIIATLTSSRPLSSPCQSSVSIAPSTNRLSYNFIFHFSAFIGILTVSLGMLIEVSKRNRRNEVKEPGYSSKIVASVFGLLLSLCYLLSAMFSFRTSLMASESDSRINVTGRCGASVVCSGLGISTDTRFRQPPASPTSPSVVASTAFMPSWVSKYISNVRQAENRESNVYDEVTVPDRESPVKSKQPT